MKDVGGAGFAGNSPPFPGREWAAVDVDVGGPERRSPRYHETCLVLGSVKESSAAAAVSKPGCVWLRVSIFKDLEKARRLPVRVEAQQAHSCRATCRFSCHVSRTFHWLFPKQEILAVMIATYNPHTISVRCFSCSALSHKPTHLPGIRV